MEPGGENGLGMTWSELIARSLEEGVELRRTMAERHREQIEDGGRLWIRTLESGGKVLLCGNGGSAADAQHLAAELVGRFERVNSLPALALTVDSSSLTAIGNDFGFEEIYAQQLRALARPQDLLVAISTSGNSPNIVRAAEEARALGLRVLGMTGAGGGRLEPLCEVCLKVPSARVCRIQEVHITVGHIWCEMVEAALPAGRSA